MTHVPTKSFKAWTRRHWLTASAGLLTLSTAGARLALGPGDAAASGQADPDKRLVIVLLRGALDGLAAVPAVGDPQWQRLRPQAQAEAERLGAPLPLDDLFALHPRLTQLHRWWGEGQLSVVHAVAQHYRERSHFDAQQLLESGGTQPFALNTGWLGRALSAAGQPSLALLPSIPLGLRGSEQASNWGPARGREPDEDLLARVQRLYTADPQFGPLWTQALAQRGMASGEPSNASAMQGESGANTAPGRMRQAADFTGLARQAGVFLSHPQGPRVAWLELGGWDTHNAQAARLAVALGTLDEGLAALRTSLGAQWAHTTVLVMTEFGRSAVMNGTGGTDHGTGGIALVAGGRVRGGRVLTDWPGLAPAQLRDGRDLRPTTDLRRVQRAVLEAHWPTLRDRMDRDILPGAPGALPDLFSS